MSLEVLYVYRYKCDRCGTVHESVSDLSAVGAPEGWQEIRVNALKIEDLCSKCKEGDPTCSDLRR